MKTPGLPIARLFQACEPNESLSPDDSRYVNYLHVFEYMNGEPWYEVNPVIRDLPKFAEVETGAQAG